MPDNVNMDGMGREQTEFNDALGKLNRINQLLYDSTIYRAQLNAYGWLHALISLYAEFYAYMKPEEITWCDIERKKSAEEVNQQVNNPRSMLRQTIKPELYERLFEWELKMRKIAKEQGMEMRMQSDPSKAFG